MSIKKTVKSNTYHHGDLKRACIDQGLKFLAQGKNDFSLRDMARELGVSHGAPSRHFSSKEALLAAIAEEGFQIFGKVLGESLVDGDLKKSFLQMGRAYLNFALAHPQHYLIMMGERIPDPDKYEGLISASSGSFNYLLDLVTELVNHSSNKNQDPLKLSYCIWSGVHGLASLGIHGLMKKITDGETIEPFKPSELKEYSFEVADHMHTAFYEQFFS